VGCPMFAPMSPAFAHADVQFACDFLPDVERLLHASVQLTCVYIKICSRSCEDCTGFQIVRDYKQARIDMDSAVYVLWQQASLRPRAARTDSVRIATLLATIKWGQ